MAARVGLPYRIRAPLQWVPRNNVAPKAAADSITEEVWSPLKAPNYLRLVLTSKVYEAATVTPLQHAPTLSATFGNTVYLKREDTQPGFSFKLRGVFNKLSSLSEDEKSKGIVTYSTGNHAFATARAASMLDIPARVVMPAALPVDRYRRTEMLGADVHVVAGANSAEAAAEAKHFASKTGAIFIHPFDDPLVIAGNGTVGMEIINQFRGKQLDAVFVCCGGGGLLAGVSAYIKAVAPHVKVIGVEGVRNDAMTQSLERGRRVSLDSDAEFPQMSLFAEGASCPQVGEETFRKCNELVDDMVVVTNDEICAAIENAFEETRAMLEPAGALALAGMKKWIMTHKVEGRSFVAVTSGANMKFDRLRFVAERSLIGEGREALLSVLIPERPGACVHHHTPHTTQQRAAITAEHCTPLPPFLPPSRC
jgi:threonine dehydratase